jgi:transcriptional regulator with XRE-family HTH domain
MKDADMPPEPHASPEPLEQLRRERALIAEEMGELSQRHDWMVEAKGEETFSGHLRRAIHRSGRLVGEIAAEAGVSSQTLCEFLEGTRTLRSDVLDRLAQALHATISVEPRRPQRVTTSSAPQG